MLLSTDFVIELRFSINRLQNITISRSKKSIVTNINLLKTSKVTKLETESNWTLIYKNSKKIDISEFNTHFPLPQQNKEF